MVTAPPASSAKAQFHTVVIGSENPVKVGAVTAVVADYPEVIRPGTVLESVTVPSGVPAQPVGLAVVVSGARRRARNAHEAAGGIGPDPQDVIARTSTHRHMHAYMQKHIHAQHLYSTCTFYMLSLLQT